MKLLGSTPSSLVRVTLAILGGLLLAASFPKIGVAGLAWVAPGIILASAIGMQGSKAFRLGFLAGFVHYLISLYWLLNIPVFKLLPLTAWLALSAFLALYAGCWVWFCWRIFPAPILEEGMENPFPQIFEGMLAASWMQRTVWTLSCAALWVAWEMMQARFLSGFPWNFLGASQFRMLPMAQIASFTGVYGISFLAVWFAVAVLCATAVVLRRSQEPRRWMGELVLPLATLLAIGFGGLRALFPPASPSSVTGASLRIALLQPSIPQQWIWSPSESSNRFQQLLALSEQALTNKPDLLVWPEAATPGFIRWDTNISDPIRQLVQRHHVWLILGADDLVARPTAKDPDAVDAYNSSFLFDPRGNLRATYRKRRLVIFGEYLPFHRWFPFLERWTGMGSFSSGDKSVPFEMPELRAKTSVLICFEDVFPHLTRDYVEPDTDFLLNLTNNGWFGRGAAQWQHAANAVFRAIENGLPLVRCANNGLTGWVDPSGRLRDVLMTGNRDIYSAGFEILEIPLLGARTRAATFYRRFGDMFGWCCVGWSVLGVGWTFARKGRKFGVVTAR